VKLLGQSPLNFPVQQWRETIRAQFKQHLSAFRFEPILRALVIGDRSDINSPTWQVLQKTGTVHLMAISGLHIGLIAGFVFALARFLWSRFPGLCMYIAAPRAAAMAAMLVAVGYAALAGFSLPTQRALVMLMVVMLGLVAYRRINVLDTLSTALVLVL
jgi:competence protein ComEC